jgi:hypothetical protein
MPCRMPAMRYRFLRRRGPTRSVTAGLCLTFASRNTPPAFLWAAGPYKNFKVQVRIGGPVVAGFQKLRLEPLQVRQPPPGTIAILQQGVTHDNSFHTWTTRWQQAAAKNGSQSPALQDVTLDVLHETGAVLKSDALRSCSVAEYQAVPDLDANAYTISISNLKLICRPLLRPHI